MSLDWLRDSPQHVGRLVVPISTAHGNRQDKSPAVPGLWVLFAVSFAIVLAGLALDRRPSGAVKRWLAGTQAITHGQLGERAEDIPSLVEFFIQGLYRRPGRRVTGVTNEVLYRLLRFEGKGNVRELQNALERAMLPQDGDLINSQPHSHRRCKLVTFSC